jgi:hypothetical protein
VTIELNEIIWWPENEQFDPVHLAAVRDCAGCMWIGLLSRLAWKAQFLKNSTELYLIKFVFEEDDSLAGKGSMEDMVLFTFPNCDMEELVTKVNGSDYQVYGEYTGFWRPLVLGNLCRKVVTLVIG